MARYRHGTVLAFLKMKLPSASSPMGRLCWPMWLKDWPGPETAAKGAPV